MAYIRKEIAAGDIERQKEICTRVREKLGPSVRYAMVDTYGCQQNESDSEILRGCLTAMGYTLTDREELADVVAVNTCAVREHAQMRVFGNVGALAKLKKEHPERIVVLCGCMAQSEAIREQIRRSYRMVDLCFGPQDLWRFPELLEQALEARGLTGKNRRVFVSGDAEGAVFEGMPRVREQGVRAWLSIMNGCNNFCSYCIVPHTRGRERSRRPEEILREARDLVESGYKDITLLGQNVNSYGKGLPGEPIDFADLLRELNRIPGNFRIRFMTSHPRDASEKLFRAMAECDKIMPQLHLPVQAGSSRILHEMNRHYDREKYLRQVDLARSIIPDLVLTTDMIVGFPGETEEDFSDTLSLVEQVRYDSMFTFIYSPRPGTKAAEMEQNASKEEIQARFDRLVETANRISAEKHAESVGKTYRVLIDGKAKNGEFTLSSRTPGGRLVHLTGDESLIGTWADVRVISSNTFAMFGEML